MAEKRSSEEELKEILFFLENNLPLNCERCGSLIKKTSQKVIKGICTWKECKKRYYTFSNTIFKGIKIDKIKCLEILDLWMHGCSVKYLSLFFRVSRTFIWRFLKNISKIIVINYEKSFKKIGGNNIIVEIDESKFGKRKYNRGHRVEGVWIFGMVERTDQRKIRLCVVDDRSARTLNSILLSSVSSDSIIYSDSWKGYKDIINNFTDHLQVNHSKNFVNPENNAHTNTIEGNWCGIKINVPYKNRTKERINLYLTRFMIKRNEPGNLLKSLIKYLF